MRVFHSLLHPLCLSPGLRSTGLEEPWKGKHARTSLVQQQRPLDLSFLFQPHHHLLSQQVAETFTFLSWGHRRPHGVPPQSPSHLTLPLLSAHCPVQAAVWLNPSRYKLTQILEVFLTRQEVSGGTRSSPE